MNTGHMMVLGKEKRQEAFSEAFHTLPPLPQNQLLCDVVTSQKPTVFAALLYTSKKQNKQVEYRKQPYAVISVCYSKARKKWGRVQMR